MVRFARLVEVEAGQVLATIETEEHDDSKHQLHLRLYHDGATITYKLGYPTQKRCIEEMESLDEAKAKSLYERIDKMLNQAITL